jgi:hypothetical protein
MTISPEFDTSPTPPFGAVADLDARANGGDTEDTALLKLFIQDTIVRSWLPQDDPRAPRILAEHDGYQVVQFNYHKSKDGELETEPRIVRVTAVFRGEHPDHVGQGEDLYLHGAQISVDEDGKLVIPDDLDDDNAKNFALNSIWGLADGELTDAKTGVKTPADELR